MSKAMESAVSDSLAPGAPDARQPRASGFVTQGSGRAADGIEDAIRSANAELQRRSGEQLAIPLAVALEQRDAAYQQLHLERQGWQAQHKNLLSTHAEELREREATLDTLRQQLRDAERELALLREDPKTVIGMGPVSTRAALLQAQDSGEHQLQNSLESAWRDVEDLRTRVSQIELERDDAVREADDLRIEAYSKLAMVRDEVIELESRLVESQRTLTEKDEALGAERNRLIAENEEIRQALHTQVQANIELRRAIASGLPAVGLSAASAPLEPHLATTPNVGAAYAAVGGHASIPPVQTSAHAFDMASFSSAPPTQPQQAPDLWADPLNRRNALPEAAPAPTLAALVGFDTSAPDAGEAALEAASALDQELQEVNRRSRGFGISRLFQRTK